MRLLEWHKRTGSFWFRVFGIGLSIQNREIHRALFSERNGYRKVLRVGKWAILPLAILALYILTACASPTQPIEPTCKYEGSDGNWYECGADTTRAGGLGSGNKLARVGQ